MIELFIKIFDVILTHKLYSILTSLIMLWLGYRLYTSKSIIDRHIQDRNKAANNFRVIFERILATIDQNPDLPDRQIVDDILIKNYPAQKIAMESLYRQLGWIKKGAFRKAWHKYINAEDCGREPFLSFCGTPWEVGKSFDRDYIIKAIEHLISFANKYPPAEPEVLRLLAPQRGLTAIG